MDGTVYFQRMTFFEFVRPLLFGLCTFDPRLVSRVNRAMLPRDWRSYPAPPELQRTGDVWLKRKKSAVLEVPSVIIDSESTYLLNPNHPDFAQVTIAAPRAFEFDLRLLP